MSGDRKGRYSIRINDKYRICFEWRDGNAYAAALTLRIPANWLTEIINGTPSISADTAMRLGRYFGTSAQMWMNLQAQYELQAAEDELVARIDGEVQPLAWRGCGTARSQNPSPPRPQLGKTDRSIRYPNHPAASSGS